MHPVFHVSMLKRYHGDGNHIIRWDSVLLDENLSYEEEATWEKEADMQERYPHMFTDSGTLYRPCFLLMIVQGRTMGKLVSIVTTCLVILNSRFYF